MVETPVVPTADPKQILLDAIKAEGLDIAEDAVLKLAKAIMLALPAFLVATPNKTDDILIPMLPFLLPPLVKIIDQIDGVDDQVL
jgi:hypothetical protein